ncbi:MAG: D-glycero-alpha-D-manno-heptose-1,7-bisphosphate 7-phosphatase [Lachnospiraceae bacterium]
MSRPAVFLDRDGVLTVEKSYVCKVDDLEIFPFAKECIDAISQKGFYVIVISNQSGVARGYFTEEALQEMNKRLMEAVGVDDVFYCPHLPSGIVRKYAIECNCRKPRIGMILEAQKKYDIDLQYSYMIGDRASDIQLGKNAGLKTVLVNSGYGVEQLEADVEPDYICKDLQEAVGFVQLN